MVTSRHLHYGESAGYAPLREAIASHVFVSRGVPCTADHVIITSGAQQGLSLIAHLLLDPGDHVLMEDPGYPGARRAFALTGARVVPLPVDASGFDIHAGVSVAPDARMVYVTPAHQYPLGVTLELARRAALLRWAGEAEAWIVEDDYDGEFQYDGPTPMALHGLDRNERVLYVGTFSATLFPSLRLGFVVVPGALVDAARAVRTAFDIHPAWLDQAVLADFIDKGHYARHLRRMRQVYQERYHALREAIGATCGELITLLRGSGLQVVGTLSSGRSDLRVAGAALTRGVEVTPLSPLYTSGCQSGLLLGFGGVDIPAIKRGCEQLAGILAWAVSQPTAS